MNLKDYIGETTSYDKKLMLELSDPISWLKSVSAFANTKGGKLLFGVRDDGEIVGLPDAQGDAEKLSEAIKAHLDPVPQVALSIHEEQGRRFVVLEVFAGDETPYYTLVKGHRDAYLACPGFREDRMPIFRSDTAFFYVVLPNLNYGRDLGDFIETTNKTTGSPTNKDVDKKDVVTLTAEALAVLREFQKDGSASAERVAKILKITPDGARYHIKNLRAAGRLMRTGNRRVGNWVVIERTGK